MTITVLDVRGKRVRLGVSAPVEVGVYRGEVVQPARSADDSRESAAAESEDPIMPVRVLIADPDEYLLDSYRGYLEQHGFAVLTATTGLECVQRLRDSGPDVLVLEPSIPWGWGDGVLAMMHEESDVPSLPVIVLTYGCDRSVLYRLAPYRIDDYQVKPMRPRQLAELIRAVAARGKCEASPEETHAPLANQEIPLQQQVGRLP